MMDERSIDDIDSFCDMLRLSGLLDEMQITGVLSEFRIRGYGFKQIGQSFTAFTSYLVANGYLTCWQYEKLRKGKYKGFFINHYKIMDILGVDHERSCSLYLCLDTNTNTYFVLYIKPRWFSQRKDGGFDFWVEEYQP